MKANSDRTADWLKSLESCINIYTQYSHTVHAPWAIYCPITVKILSRDEMKTWISSSVLPLHTCKFDLCHQGGLWNHVAAHQSVTEPSVHTNAGARLALSSVMEREAERKQAEKISLQRKINTQEKWVVLTFSEYFIQEKNKVKHNFQVYKGLLFHAAIDLPSAHCTLNSPLLLNTSAREEIWLLWSQKQQSQRVFSLSIISAASFPWSLPVYRWCSKSWL